MPPSFVIVNADDFGINASINEGIEVAHTSGVVTSASIMVLGEAFADALARSRKLPQLDLGLHFCLLGVEGFPRTLSDFGLALIRGQISRRFIVDSLRKQLDLAIGVHRLAISHIDSHQHVHALPFVMRLICQIAPEYGIYAVRLPRERHPRKEFNIFRRTQLASLNFFARQCADIIADSNLKTTDAFTGMAFSGHLTSRSLLDYLSSAANGVTEIVCHPGVDNETLGRSLPWGYNWFGDLCALCDPAVRAWLSPGSVELVSWRDAFNIQVSP